MELPKDAIIELQEIHHRLTGENLSFAQATTMADELFRLFLAIYEPVPKEWLECVSGGRKESKASGNKY